MPSTTEILPNPIRLDGDEPRARRTDPVESHLAADLSQVNLSAVRLVVLQLVAQEQPVIGSEINDVYALRLARGAAPFAHWDSPRKRLSWLNDNGFIEVVGSRVGMSTVHEREFAVTEFGRAVLRQAVSA